MSQEKEKVEQIMKITKKQLMSLIRESYEETLRPKFYDADDMESALMKPGKDKDFDATRPTRDQILNLTRNQEKIQTFKDTGKKSDLNFAHALEQGLLPDTPIFYDTNIYTLILESLESDNTPVTIIDDLSKQEFSQEIAKNPDMTVSDLFYGSLPHTIPRRQGTILYPDPSTLDEYQHLSARELPDVFLLETDAGTYAIMFVYGGSNYTGNNISVVVRYYDGYGPEEVEVNIKKGEVAMFAGSTSSYFEKAGILDDLIYSWLSDAK